MVPVRGYRAFLVLGGLLLLAGLAAAGNWPRFRGPNGTGTVDDKDVPIHWSADQGVLWKTAIPGKGYSSPIVWGDRLFLQSASADGAQRWLLCVDTHTGKVLWTRTAPAGAGTIHKRNSYASCTPATDGERVYVVFWDGKGLLMCGYDFQGELVWQRDLGKYTSQHGPGHSPIVYQGRVIYANDQDGSAELLALDARTGKPVWQVERPPYRACYSTPLLLENGVPLTLPSPPGGEGRVRGTELIVASTAGITSYDPTSGRENWKYVWSFTKKPLRTVASPVVADGMVLATSGDGDGSRHVIAVRLGGQGDVTRTHLVWENSRACPYVPTMLALGEHLYSVNDEGSAICQVAQTGEVVWKERLGRGMTASPILVDGKIYAACEDGSVCVFPAATTFKLLAKNSIGEPISATPAVADNRLFIRGMEHLFCIGKPAGK